MAFASIAQLTATIASGIPLTFCLLLTPHEVSVFRALARTVRRVAPRILIFSFLILPLNESLADYEAFIIDRQDNLSQTPHSYHAQSESALVPWVQSWYQATLSNQGMHPWCNATGPLTCRLMSTEEFFWYGYGFPYRVFDMGFYSYPPFTPSKGIICTAPAEARCGYSPTLYGGRPTLAYGALIRGPSYKVKIAPVDSSPSNHGAGYVTDIGPTDTLDSGIVTSTQLVAKVVDEDGQSVPNINVKISLKAISSSGGHDHDSNDPARPTGKLNGQASTAGNAVSVSGSTGADGFAFTYEAPAVSGDYRLVATCMDEECPQEGPDKIWVGVPNLIAVPDTAVWHLYGEDEYHSKNHYLNLQALEALAILASQYKISVPSKVPVLWLNDASLERGGLFDCYVNYTSKSGIRHTRPPWWTPDHKEHRLGTVIDVQANGEPTAIPDAYLKTFEHLITDVIRGTFVEELGRGHIHVRLLGPRG